MLKYNSAYKVFYWAGDYESRQIPRNAGFDWDNTRRIWFTKNLFVAYRLSPFADFDLPAMEQVQCFLERSHSKEPITRFTNELFPFQEAGVEALMLSYAHGNQRLAIFDEQGLGKTAQAIEFCNRIGAWRIVVVCPANLRINWCREFGIWGSQHDSVEPILTGKDKVNKGGVTVTSYELAEKIPSDYTPDVLIVDESHYLKNPDAKRTQLILDTKSGMARKATKASLFLSGTPLPNGRPDELYPLLNACMPSSISRMSYWKYIQRFCEFYDDGYTVKITGGKNLEELGIRLRGSGFMIRRMKKDVLTQLPDKRYKMVVFPASGPLAKIIEREKEFDAREIIISGGDTSEVSILPEIRREMAEAKVPAAVSYIKDMLESGTEKVVIFGHHVEPMKELFSKLEAYNPVMVIGTTRPNVRQDAMDRFQNAKSTRVFLGNEAAEEGITLTAASDVVLFEPEWVPGKNDQRADRCHRIGQKNSVLIHYLVVEGSLDAIILGRSMSKQSDIRKVLS